MDIGNIKWFLIEIGASDAENIESNDFEIMGEDAGGNEGMFTVQINEVASQASKYVNELELEMARLKTALEMYRDFISEQDIDCFGSANNGEGLEWPVRDQIIDNMTKDINLDG